MEKEMYLQKIEELIKSGCRLAPSDGHARCCELADSKNHKSVIIKIKNEHYQQWYDGLTDKTYSIEEETIYITSTNNKAFKSGMIGYSIFANSLADLKRMYIDKIESAFYSVDRIEHMPYEWYIIDEEGVLE